MAPILRYIFHWSEPEAVNPSSVARIECPLLAQSRHRQLHRTRPLLTQSGHRGRKVLAFKPCISVALRGPMKRREFITLLGGAAATWPLAAHAQQPDRCGAIGVLMAHAENDPEFQAYVSAFREGLQKLGWTEGRNIRIDFRWGALDAELRQRSAIELIALKPDLIRFAKHAATAQCCSTRILSQSFSWLSQIRSAAASSRAWRGQAATSPVSPLWSQRLPASGWSCSRRLRRASTGSPSCSTRQRRHMPNIYLNPFKAAAASFGVEAIAAPVHDTAELESALPHRHASQMVA